MDPDHDEGICNTLLGEGAKGAGVHYQLKQDNLHFHSEQTKFTVKVFFRLHNEVLQDLQMLHVLHKVLQLCQQQHQAEDVLALEGQAKLTVIYSGHAIANTLTFTAHMYSDLVMKVFQRDRVQLHGDQKINCYFRGPGKEWKSLAALAGVKEWSNYVDGREVAEAYCGFAKLIPALQEVLEEQYAHQLTHGKVFTKVKSLLKILFNQIPDKDGFGAVVVVKPGLLPESNKVLPTYQSKVTQSPLIAVSAVLCILAVASKVVNPNIGVTNRIKKDAAEITELMRLFGPVKSMLELGCMGIPVAFFAYQAAPRSLAMAAVTEAMYTRPKSTASEWATTSTDLETAFGIVSSTGSLTTQGASDGEGMDNDDSELSEDEP
ncbi:hypothetical protein M427DRAFT_47031 [Gonapodya prolifera JEL478]|uniref:Uncharacterized protein n=1 Tax=Gonapodya prolifera (strain JEL478) TaxID=1344416 RepID=A0A139A4X2_GONPJ|nr:hypothetical protein M427DRAFT_47031 [Gonapodya prolifera JEL478]|eukprot:KXS11678.1 hypothetical protein M427DRAFT_47031 [Gonapodya prolifera JEL478]